MITTTCRTCTITGRMREVCSRITKLLVPRNLCGQGAFVIINKLNVHILSKYEQNVSKRLTYVVYSVIINTEHTFYIGEYKNEKRTKPRGRVGMHSSALFYIRAAPQSLNFQLPPRPFLCLSDKYEARIFTNFTKKRDKKRKVCYNEIDIGTGALRAVRQFL